MHGNPDSIKAIQLYHLVEENHENEELYLKYANEAIPLLYKIKQWHQYFLLKYYVAGADFEHNKFQIAEEKFQDLYKELISSTAPDSTQLDIRLYLVVFYAEKANYQRSLELTLEALAIAKSAKRPASDLGDIYTNLSFLANTKGNLTQAIEYSELALKEYISTGDSLSFNIANLYNNTGSFYRRSGDFDRSLRNHQRAIDLLENKEDAHQNREALASFLLNGAFSLYKQDAYEQSNIFLTRVKKIRSLPEKYRAIANKQLALNHIHLGNLELGKQFIDKALLQHLEIYKDKHDNTATCYAVLATYYEKKGAHIKALENYHTALCTLLPNEDNTTDYKKEFSNLEGIISEINFLQYAQKKASLLEKELLYKEAFYTYQVAVQLTKKLYSEYLSAESKLFLTDNALVLFGGGIRTSIQLFNETKDSSYLEKAFQLSEQYKSNILLEKLQNAEALGQLEVTDSLRQQISLLQKEIIFLSTKLTTKALDSLTQITALEYKLELERKLVQLEQQIEQKYPRYASLKKQNTVRSLKYLEKELDEETLIIEYFVGKEDVYAFYISTDRSIEIKKIAPYEALKKEIGRLLKFYQEPHLFTNAPDKYEKTAHLLSKSLGLYPFLKNSPYKKILVIPDGIISLISFGTLILEQTSTSQFGEMDFLIKQSAISYAYSTTLLDFQEKFNTINSANILGVAPSFSSNDLLDLPYNEEEINSIPINKKKTLLGQKAKMNVFLKQANQFSIIHLATHSYYDSLLLQPVIEFYDQTLLLSDLYNQNINADLVVLSSCKSASGEIRNGEGVMSLARGFTFAGAKSLIASIWKVNDLTTSQLFLSFYTFLNKGLTKSKALQLAKLKFLSNPNIPNAKKSPYYWSSFILIGNDHSISLQQSNYLYYIGMALLLIALLFFIKFTNQ